jgi:hypothetical protein
MKVYIYLHDWHVDYDMHGTNIVWVSDELHLPTYNSIIQCCHRVEFWEDGIKQWTKEQVGKMSPNWI